MPSTWGLLGVLHLTIRLWILEESFGEHISVMCSEVLTNVIQRRVVFQPPLVELQASLRFIHHFRPLLDPHSTVNWCGRVDCRLIEDAS